jgi:hypothetical protein
VSRKTGTQNKVTMLTIMHNDKITYVHKFQPEVKDHAEIEKFDQITRNIKKQTCNLGHVRLADVISCAKFHVDRSRCYGGAGSKNRMFP